MNRKQTLKKLKKLLGSLVMAIVLMTAISIVPLQANATELMEEEKTVAITIDNSNTHVVIRFYPDTNDLNNFEIVEIGGTKTFTVSKDSVARIRLYIQANGYRLPDDYKIEGATKLTNDDKVNYGWCRGAYTITADTTKTIVLPKDSVCTHPYADPSVRWGYYDCGDGTHAQSCTLCSVDIPNTVANHDLSEMTPTEYADWYYNDNNFAGLSQENIASMKAKMIAYITEKLGVDADTKIKACNKCEHYEKIDETDTAISAPEISGITGCGGKAKITWKKVSEATGYIVYRKTGSESYKEVKTIAKADTVSYTDSAVKVGKTYTYTVKAVKGSVQSDYQTGKSVKIIESHKYNDVVTKKATTSKKGNVTQTCKLCNKVTETTIYAAKTIKLSKDSYTYDGKAKKPGIIVKDSKGKTISSSYYTVSYKNNKNVGTATATIKFKGRYSSNVTKKFEIAPKGTSISKVTASTKGFTVKWKKQKTQTTGYQISYSTNKNFKSAKTVTVDKKSTVSTRIKGLKAKQKYYVRVRTFKKEKVNGKNKITYSAWSSAKKVTTK